MKTYRTFLTEMHEDEAANYERVIPRDLFNEADLMKCLGRLYIESEKHPVLHNALSLDHDGGAFRVHQSKYDGSIHAHNVNVYIHGEHVHHYRPLNTRTPHALWFAPEDGDDFKALNEDGTISDDLVDYVKSKHPNA